MRLSARLEFTISVLAIESSPALSLSDPLLNPVQELSETFQVSIFRVENASMSFATQTAVVTIVGINDTPEPQYIENMIE